MLQLYIVEEDFATIIRHSQELYNVLRSQVEVLPIHFCLVVSLILLHQCVIELPNLRESNLLL